MAYEDKTLVCGDCSENFIFTSGEQSFYAEKGFVNEPRRCPTCRRMRRSDRGGGGGFGGGGGGYGGPRMMYPIVCAQCGKDAEVPFQPRGDRPVYCSDCYSTQNARGGGGGGGGGGGRY